MDGFVEEVENGIAMTKNQQIFLFEFPKDFKAELLDNVELEYDTALQSWRTEILLEKTNQKFIIEQQKELNINGIFRPIVRNEIDGHPYIGKSFAGIFKCYEEIINKSIALTDLPITSYKGQEQLPFLGVRSLPNGSMTSLQELNMRKRHIETSSTNIKKKKKDKKANKKMKEDSSSK